MPIVSKKLDAKGIAWFKTTKEHRRHGHIWIERYFQILDDGTISVIDMTRLKFANQRTFGGENVSIELSSQEEWNDKVEQIRQIFK